MVCDWSDAQASEEFGAVLVKELGHRARGAAGDRWKVPVV
jgi:hypothetical protein